MIRCSRIRSANESKENCGTEELQRDFTADVIIKFYHQIPEPQGSRGEWDRKRIHEVCGERYGGNYGSIHTVGSTRRVVGGKGFVVKLFKKEDKIDPTNYRDIRLLNTVGKLFRKLLNDRIVGILEKESRISKGQAAFRRNRNCVHRVHIREDYPGCGRGRG